MSISNRWNELVQAVRAELRQLPAINKTDRLWQMPVAAALASGLPLLVGAYSVTSTMGWCRRLAD